MISILKNSFYIVSAICFLLSCDSACVAEKQMDLPQSAWAKDSGLCAVLPVTDTLSYCNILITLRNNDDYPYNNIILSVTAVAPSGDRVCDTVEYRLTDERGAWLGRTGGKWIDHRLAFRNEVKFAQSGDYQFCIAHLMRDEPLKGLGAVGVRIEKAE